jgi:hypothetical protein
MFRRRRVFNADITPTSAKVERVEGKMARTMRHLIT